MILTRLKEIRLNQALSMRALAARSGVTPTTIVKAEKGEPVYPATVRRLASALSVQPAELQSPSVTPASGRRAQMLAQLQRQADACRERGDTEGAARFEATLSTLLDEAAR